MTVEKLNTLEDRIEKPGYLLFIIVVLLFLIIGFVNLLSFESQNKVIFNRYSIKWVGLMAVYLAATLAWASLLLKPNDDRLLKKGLDYVQKRPVLAIGILIVFAGIFASMFFVDRWLNLPALQVAVTAIMLLFTGLILFYRWGDASRPQLWRKVIVYPLAFLLVVELAIQFLTVFNIPPNVTQLTDSFSPYSRVYHSAEGHGSGFVNRFGWHYPEFRMLPDSHRILLFGDSFVQALQINPEDNMGIVLESLIAEKGTDGQPVEVLALGNPDYGPGLYLNVPMIEYAVAKFEPDEVIAFFEMGNDFQSLEGPNDSELFFVINEEGVVEIHPDHRETRHTYQHEVLHGYEGFQLNRFLRTSYLTPHVINAFFNPSPAAAASGTHSVTTDSIDDEVMALATGHIDLANEYFKEQGIDFRLVTIPVFSDSSLTQNDWDTIIEQDDFLLPEQELQQFAEEKGMPFLGLGTYMSKSGIKPGDVKQLYFNVGLGHFTPAGHEFAATAVNDCFYSGSAAAEAGCDAR